LIDIVQRNPRPLPRRWGEDEVVPNSFFARPEPFLELSRAEELGVREEDRVSRELDTKHDCHLHLVYPQPQHTPSCFSKLKKTRARREDVQAPCTFYTSRRLDASGMLGYSRSASPKRIISSRSSRPKMSRMTFTAR